MKEKDFIKQLVELAEGFKLIVTDYHIRVTFKTGIVLIKNIRKWQFYPLLLYRAMEGWNKEAISVQTGEAMWLQPEAVFVFLGDDEVNIGYSDYQSTKYLTAQEQALEEALKEVFHAKG